MCASTRDLLIVCNCWTNTPPNNPPFQYYKMPPPNNNSKNTDPVGEEEQGGSNCAITKSIKKRKILDLEKGFYHHILTALSSVEGEIKLATFSSYFQIYLVGKGLPQQSLKKFANSYGIPKNRTFIEMIDDYFPKDILYRREGQYVVHIWIKNREVFECLADEDE